MALVGIIDVDFLAGRQKRFPNLAAMKLAAWHKQRRDTVRLLQSFSEVQDFPLLYLCCVFTDSAKAVPKRLLERPGVIKGGTGFFFDRAEPLRDEIEHSYPDYSLYQGENEYYYTSASIGFLTRGCFRRCKFCVNRNRTEAVLASPLAEFYNPTRPRVCLLDDNALAYNGIEDTLNGVVQTCERDGTQFEFKQGIDIRLFRPELAKCFGSSAHFGEVIFAFDLVSQAKSVRRGLSIFREHSPHKGAKAYVLCGFESQGPEDVASTFRRIEILWSYKCLAYVMRHQNCAKASPECRRLYTHLAAWANQPQFQRSQSFRQFCNLARGKTLRSLREFEAAWPEIASRFFDITYKTTPRAF